MNELLNILPQPHPTIRVVDVGAMMYGTEPYETLRAAGLARVIGFEPQAEECARLNAAHAARGDRYLPHFVGDGSERTFHFLRHPASSSLYEPDLELAEKFQQLGELYRVLRTQRVQTRRLDDIEEVRPCDFLKLDAQGAELDIIRGGEQTVRQALVVHTEVEFVPLYKQQPLFADVDRALRAMGFAFHRFYSIAGRAFVPVVADNNPNKRISQMLWANAVYVRDFMRLEELSAEQLLKLAVIARGIYRAVDLAHLALAYHDRAEGGDLAAKYLNVLTGGGV